MVMISDDMSEEEFEAALEKEEAQANGEDIAEESPGVSLEDTDLAKYLPKVQSILGVPVEVTAEIGGVTMPLQDVLKLDSGSVVSLNREVGEPISLLVNGYRIAHGEVVSSDDKLGVRITEIITPNGRLAATRKK